MNNKESVRHKKKWLQWVLDFAQTNLNSLSPPSKRNLLGEMSYFCSEKFIKEDWDEYEGRLELLTLQEYQDFTEFDDDGKPIDIVKLQKKTITLLDSMKHIHKQRREDRAIERVLVYKDLPNVSSYIVSHWKGTFEIIRHPSTPSPENWLILNFMSLIEKFDTYPIYKCKGKSKAGECGRYFLNLTKREKLFCTPSCASRSIAQKKRDKLKENPREWKAYLRKMRKYQKERFDKKQREKAGPNVRVGRNKRRVRKED